MRLVLRRFVTPRAGGFEIALWSPAPGKPVDRPTVQRCMRLFAPARARSRERRAELQG